MTDKDRSNSYVDKVRGETQRYMRQLLQDAGELRAALARLESDNSSLKQELLNARADLDLRKQEEYQLREKLSAIRSQSEAIAQQFQQVEYDNSNLMNLYVASYQLHGTLDRDHVVAAVREIIINLIGSEEFAVLELDRNGELRPVCSMGASFEQVQESRQLHAGVWQNALDGTRFVADGQNGEDTALTACVPMTVDGRVTGVLAVFRLLPHKSQLEQIDHELFDLLASQAGTALYVAAIATTEAGGPL